MHVRFTQTCGLSTSGGRSLERDYFFLGFDDMIMLSRSAMSVSLQLPQMACSGLGLGLG